MVLVDGAMCYRGQGPMPAVARELASEFTVYTYDRRGRGDSGDTGPYSIEREIEDLDALIKEAGGSASVFGASSGAVLALEAANHGLPVRKLALYEPPFIVDDTRTPTPDDFDEQVDTALAEGKPGEAVTLFMKLVQVPAFAIVLMRLLPVWPKLKRIAHTLPYDLAFVQDFQRGKPLPADRWTSITAPVLVADGGKSPAWIRNGAKGLADVLPTATYRTVPGQTHMVKAKVHAPVIAGFFRD